VTIPGFPESLVATDEGVVEPAGAVGEPTIAGLPEGYRYGVTRYADLILKEAFPDHLGQLSQVLADFRPARSELVSGGGNKASFTRRFDEALRAHGWGKRNIEIGKTVDGSTISRVRGHEIDMFLAGPTGGGWPGIAVEMEWNNKDPFFDRDLLNFQALHREGVLAVGVVVTRGPALQERLKLLAPKYGESTTHWRKLVSRVNLGGGGECPLFLIGIEPARIQGFA
jgi:hypothetical protein